MAFDPTPSSWMDVLITDDGQEVFDRGPCLIINASDLFELDSAGNDATDIRRIVWAIIDGLYRIMTSKPVGDRPTTIRVFRDAAEVSDNRRVANYVFSFDLQTSGQEVRPEP